MENQENVSGNQGQQGLDKSRSSLSSPPGGTPGTGEGEESGTEREFGGGESGGEIDTGKLHDNQEVDLDRTGPNEPNEPNRPQKQTQQQEQQRPYHVHPGEGTSRGYESNTPDIDEETLRSGGAGEELKKQSGQNRGGQKEGQFGQGQDDTRRS